MHVEYVECHSMDAARTAKCQETSAQLYGGSVRMRFTCTVFISGSTRRRPDRSGTNKQDKRDIYMNVHSLLDTHTHTERERERHAHRVS